MTVEGRTLVLTPRGRDGELTAELLGRHDIEAHVCATGDELLAAIEAGAGCAIVTEDSLNRSMQASLAKLLGHQPPWSDFPLLILASVQSAHHLQLMASSLGNVTVIERPIAPQTLITAVRAALRGRKRQYEARAAIEQRDQFLAMLGHELRTPLGAVVLATELARSGTDRVVVSERLDVIARQSTMLARLVDDLLDVARVTSGKIRLRREAVDIVRTVRSCLAAAAEQARARSIEVVFVREDPATIEADLVRVEQVVNNLLANAIKYSSSGSRVEVSTALVGEVCEIRVRDHGIGIAPEMQRRVFDLFAQVDTSLSRSEGGMGIGLTLVDRLVRLHGGSVRLESAGIGQGSEFIVRLPVGTAEQPVREGGGGAHGSDKLRVVLVEDNPDLRTMTASLLEAIDCTVAVADDGPDGVELVVSERPDLALIDIGLPTLDGFQVARKIRDSLGASLMLVAVTGYGRDQDRANAREAGFDLFLTKPLSFDVVRQVLDSARAKRVAVERKPTTV